MNQGQVNSYIQQARDTGQQLQNQYNQQAAEQYSAYKGNQANANQAYSDLRDFTRNMQSPTQMYNKELAGAQSMYGFDPKAMATATQNLTRSQNALQALQQASQSSTGGYGLSAAQLGGYYGSQAQPLSNQVTAQGNAVQNYKDLIAATQQQANQAATLGYQGQALQSQNYQSLYNTSVQQMQTSGQVLNQIQQLQQQQGGLTAQQVQAYQDAYSTYLSAQAAMTQASAAMTSAQAQAGLYNAQAAGQRQQNDQYATQFSQNQKALDAQRAAAAAKASTPARSTDDQVGSLISQGFKNVAKYGPLALLGAH